MLGVRRQRVGGHDPAALAQQVGEGRNVRSPGVLGLQSDDRELRAVGDQAQALDLLEFPGQRDGRLEHRPNDFAVAVEAEAQEGEVLQDHRGRGPGEVQRVVRHVAAEVVDVEDQLLRNVRGVAEDNSSHARVDEPELVIGDVDRAHRGEPEVPFLLGPRERRDEAPRGRVDVQRHAPSPL